ncbi:MAG: cytochrome-c peroxidase [Alphaproteobacteria bacterium]
MIGTASVAPTASAESAASVLPPPLTAESFHPVDPARVRIGQLLFFDPILSGNRNISCATCHNPDHGTTDGLSLGIGEGGMGVSINRTPGTGADRIKKRIPRNAPALWNLGAIEIRQMFHDGRVTHSADYDNDFATPAQEWLPEGLSGLLAVQALFPMTAQFEMAGDPAENEVAGAAYSRIDEVWPIIAKRVRVIPAYSDLFIEAYDDVDDPLDITITHLANALADFQNFEFQSYDSRFDSYLKGDLDALNDAEKDGMALFYGKAGCSGCHSGSLLTDHDFHALMLPHFGPGRTRVWDTIVRDVGRMSFTDRLEDAYRFRTPSLRNVALTGPYGHNGAYASLEDMVRHHLNPRESFEAWNPDNLILPEVPWLAHVDFLSFEDRLERARLSAQLDIEPKTLSDGEIDQLLSFLGALTGEASTQGRLGRPSAVPSGLPID